MISTASVTVVYEPDAERLERQLEAIQSQVDLILLVVNGGYDQLGFDLDRYRYSTPIKIVTLGNNLGIAAAINRGIEECKLIGVHYSLLLDQDSIPAPNLVHRLRAGLVRAASNVAAAGPRIIDHGCESRSVFSALDKRQQASHADDGAAKSDDQFVDFLITSGTLLKVEAINVIGLMEEALFIDSVDFEWCFRARSLGFKLLVVNEAILDHQRGAVIYPVRLKIFPLRWHSPFRQYFIMRNRLTLYGRPYVPISWKLKDFPRMVVKVLVYIVLVPPRIENLKAIIRGFVDALNGRLGPNQS
ncbi:glycosyltransferase [Simiduia sp. 21SJ11W-1]|uniref:glycosyltransferase n=1 Tax=Simiduia sp. 21SJ11W-1 TaxID=2909669 RepID=UPI0020A07786|nr:glycosyltransferase [Simiduia sp. 21SJ11W-1]UTA49548.1 glycosyltransferase [Simiduia sp. 21SJ11W-1]